MKRVILLSSLYLIFGLSYPNMLFAESGLVFHASSGTITGRLDMAGFDIDSVGEIDATRYQINGSTMVAILPGTGSLGVGVDAGRVNTGNNNSFVGYRSGYNTTTGNYNSFLGYKAGHSNTIGGANSFVGFQAGYNNTGNYNSFVGGNAGYNNTTGINNSFLGYQAGYSNTTGANNSFMGYMAGYFNTTGTQNSFVGYRAGYLNTEGNYNSFLGYAAGYSNTTGANNSFMGRNAGRYNKTGSANAILGNEAGYGVVDQSFSSSTIMGYQAGYNTTTGSDNLLLGWQSGDILTTGSNNIIIGYDEDAPTATTSDYLNIGGIIVGDLSTSSVTVLGDLYANEFYGAQTLPADPTSAMQAATKQYVDAATGESGACPTGMAYIPGPYPYCIDKYEAYLLSGTVTNCTCTNGSKAEVDACGSTAVAGSASGQTPLVNINWCAAKKACQLAGKHLLTNSEWFNAANYKGSKWNITAEETGETMGCNTGSAAATLTGAQAGCVTQEGVFDMIGNVVEWVDFVMTANPTNGLANGYVTGYDFATGIPTSVGTSANAYGNDYHWAYNGAGAARAVLRGGSWDPGVFAGVFAFIASAGPSHSSSLVGFRCGRRR